MKSIDRKRAKTISITLWDPQLSLLEHYSTRPLCERASDSTRAAKKVIIIDKTITDLQVEDGFEICYLIDPGSYKKQIISSVKKLMEAGEVIPADRTIIKFPNSTHSKISARETCCYYASGSISSHSHRKSIYVENGKIVEFDTSLNYLVSTFSFESLTSMMKILIADVEIEDYFIGKNASKVTDFEDYIDSENRAMIANNVKTYFVRIDDILIYGNVFRRFPQINKNLDDVKTIVSLHENHRVVFITKHDKNRNKIINLLESLGIEKPEMIWNSPDVGDVFISNKKIRMIQTDQSIALGLK